MFEGSLVASRGLQASETHRWTALASLTVQCGFAALLLAIPMLRPGSIPIVAGPPHLIAPTLPKPPLTLVPIKPVTPSTDAPTAPAPAASAATSRPLIFLSHPGHVPNDDPTPIAIGIPQSIGGPGPLIALSAVGSNTAPAISATRAPVNPARVSSGVSSGLLLTAIQPIYPTIAKIVGIQGTVVIEATISKTGSIESLHALSGPPMLCNAALDAVQAARYRPYRLNGEPTAVQTTITLVFRLGN